MTVLKNRFKRNDFNNLFKRGKTINGELVFLKFRKNNLEDSHFCWVVGLKISKKSTTRNRIKRQLRDITKKNLEDTKPGFNIAVIAKPKIINKKYQEIKKEIQDLLKVIK